MDTEQIRIAVAECLGYAMFSEYDIGLGIHLCADVWPGQEDMGPREVPNYPASLDACAEFEKTLTKQEKEQYGWTLHRIVEGDKVNEFEEAFDFNFFLSEITNVAFATALQRCEAFLRVKGKWTE